MDSQSFSKENEKVKFNIKGDQSMDASGHTTMYGATTRFA